MHRLGAVRYLNTKPLIHGLMDDLPECTLEFDFPSRLADRLNDQQLDIALIPSVEFLRGRSLTILSDACIGCRGPVRSVRLLFRCDPRDVRTLALDEGSRTSCVLSQVLLRAIHNVTPKLEPFAIDTDLAATTADAVLVIGDRAMSIDAPGIVEDWDLGEKWFEFSGLPFVFAMWVARSGGSSEPHRDYHAIADALEHARDRGLADAHWLSTQYHHHYNITPAECERYFCEQLAFHLGEA
ncbi:MAG TPA: hypothetical protein DDW52_23325, partial [Planctomycetaceae bacterium]|nr:hypothetical protein [Planctomycetaceae bacterium]